MSTKPLATRSKKGHKRSAVEMDRLADSQVEYIKRVYAEFYDIPKVSLTVLMKRSLNLLSWWVQHALAEGLQDREKANVESCTEYRLSPFGEEGLPKNLAYKEDNPKPFLLLGSEVMVERLKAFREEINVPEPVRNPLDVLKIGEPTNG